jgi:hypothetical protein
MLKKIFIFCFIFQVGVFEVLVSANNLSKEEISQRNLKEDSNKNFPQSNNESAIKTEFKNKHSLKLLFGYYSIKSSVTNLTGLGVTELQYAYAFYKRINFDAAYSMTLKNFGSGALISGFDIGAGYCFLDCYSFSKFYKDTIEVIEAPIWSINLSLGISQRFFHLSTQTLVFTGPYGKIFIEKNLDSVWKLNLGYEQFFLSNVNNSLTIGNILTGVSFSFGANNEN